MKHFEFYIENHKVIVDIVEQNHKDIVSSRKKCMELSGNLTTSQIIKMIETFDRKLPIVEREDLHDFVRDFI